MASIEWITPPDSTLPSREAPVVFRVVGGASVPAISVRFADRPEERAFRDDKFLPPYDQSSRSGDEFTLRRRGGWLSDMVVFVDEATATSAPVQSVFGRIGDVLATLGDYSSSLIENLSTITGETVTEALDALAAALSSLSTAVSGKAPLSARYVTTAADATLTDERVLTAGLSTGMALVDDGPGLALRAVRNTAYLATNSTAYTLVANDAWRQITFQQPATTVTIPLNATVPFPIGTEVYIRCGHFTPATLEIVGAAGVTVEGPSGTTARGRATRSLITLIKVSTDYWLMSGELAGSSTRAVVTQTASYTLAITDADTVQYVNSATPVTVTIPAAVAPTAWPSGCVIEIYQAGAGQVTLAPDAGVSIRNALINGTAKTAAQYSTIKIRRITANQWAVMDQAEDPTSYLTLGTSGYYPNERVLTAGTGTGIALTDAGAGGNLTVARNTINLTVNVTAYTPGLADAWRHLNFSQANTVVTAPSDATANIPVGTEILLRQAGAGIGQVSVVAGSGASLTVPSGRVAATRAQGAVLTLLKGSANSWFLTGNLLNDSGVEVVSRTADYTLALSDAGTIQYVNSATPVTVTIPDHATVPIPAGATIDILQVAAGQVTVVGAAGVVLRSPLGGTVRTATQYASLRLTKTSSTGWMVNDFTEDPTPYVTLAATGIYPNERVLTEGPGVSIVDGGPGNAVTVSGKSPVNAWTSGTTRTLAAGDNYAVIRCTVTGSPQLTVPLDASVSLPIGYTVGVLYDVAAGANTLTVVLEGGVVAVTLNAPLTLSPQAGATLQKVAANRWWLVLGTPASVPAPGFVQFSTAGGALNPAVIAHDSTIVITYAGNSTIPIPANDTYAWPLGSRLRIIKDSTGTATLDPDAGVSWTLRTAYISPTDQGLSDWPGDGTFNVFLGQGAYIDLVKIGTNRWQGSGVFAMDNIPI